MAEPKSKKEQKVRGKSRNFRVITSVQRSI